MSRLRLACLAVALAVLDPAAAFAGMPSVTLSDAARMRVQNLSFFLLGLLVSAGMIQWLWNFLRRDFTALPRLSYGKALGVVTLWGLLFVLVLTMISGARELLTPGAWVKQGLTYRLADDAAATDEQDWARRQKLDRLRVALWQYAASHQSHFPPDSNTSEIPADAWQLPGPAAMRYVYVPGATADRAITPLAYETDVFGPKRYVLFTNGEIRQLRLDEFAASLPAEGRR
jgi:hypothetical protein